MFVKMPKIQYIWFHYFKYSVYKTMLYFMRHSELDSESKEEIMDAETSLA